MGARTCDVCGDRITTLGLRRRVGLWLRDAFLRVSAWADRATASPFQPGTGNHLHLTAEEVDAWMEGLDS